MDSTLFSDLRRERAPEQVTERLREAITSGLLQPGDRLLQEELADRLGVSRMPIREALRRLEAEGLVVLQPYRGAVVASLSSRELQEIYEIRVALETLALRLGVPHMDAPTLDALETTLVRMDTEVDSSAWLALNTEFHSTLYGSARRGLLCEHIQNLRNKSDRFLRLFASQRDRTVQAQDEHWAVFRACREGRVDDACRLLEGHLLSTIDSLSETLRAQERETTPPPEPRASASRPGRDEPDSQPDPHSDPKPDPQRE